MLGSYLPQVVQVSPKENKETDVTTLNAFCICICAKGHKAIHGEPRHGTNRPKIDSVKSLNRQLLLSRTTCGPDHS